MAIRLLIDEADALYAESGAVKDLLRWVRIGERRLSSSMRGRARAESYLSFVVSI